MTEDPRTALAQRLSALRQPSPPQAQIDALAAQEFTAASADERVTAVVNGAGELLRLEVSVLATRGEARADLPAGVVGTVNAALDQVDAARRELAPGGDVAGQLDALTEQFGRRMDGLLDRLDEVSSRLPPVG